MDTKTTHYDTLTTLCAERDVLLLKLAKLDSATNDGTSNFHLLPERYATETAYNDILKEIDRVFDLMWPVYEPKKSLFRKMLSRKK